MTGLASLLRRWRQRAYERRALLSLSERELRDIGITHLDALREADKPIWRS